MHGARLRYRPAVCEGESWLGYLLRAANENGIGGIPSLAALLDLTPDRLLRAPPAQVLERLCPSGVELAATLEAGDRGYFKMRTRVCPECIKSDPTPYVRASWDSPLVLICPAHNILLTDRCVHCGRPVQYGRPSLGTCRCSQALDANPKRRPAPWIREMYELMGCVDLVYAPRRAFSTISAQENKCAGSIFRLCRKAASKAGQGRVPKYKFLASEDVPVLERVFGNGESSVFERLASLQARGVRADGAGIVPNTEVARIWSQIRRDLAQARTLGKQKTPGIGAQGYVSKRLIMKATKLHPTAIDYLVASGLLKGVLVNDRFPQYPGSVLVPAAEFQGLLALMSSTMSIKEAAHFAQTDMSTVRALGRAGALRVFRLGRAEYVFRLHAADLSSLIKDLTRGAQRYKQAPEALIELSAAIQICSRRVPSKLARMIEDLRLRRLRLFVVRSHAIYLGDLFVLAADFQTWIEAG